MANRQLKFDQEVRDKVLAGVNLLADAVATTLGPKGRNVTIKMGPNHYQTYHDGVTVAKSIFLKDEFMDAAAQQLKEAAIKTNDVAGDGTTTATILAQAIINEAMKQINAGTNPQTIKSEIEQATTTVLEELKELAKEVTTPEEIEQVATISSASPELGKLVADALKQVGNDGVITVEMGSGFETTVDYKQGMEIDRGYLSPYFVNKQETVEAEMNNPYILITDKRLVRGYDIVPFLEMFIKSGNKDLVIFAGELSDEAMATVIVNHLRGSINCIAIQAPAFGGRRVDELEDLAFLTGGTAILEDSGRSLDTITLEELGRADKVVSDRDKTIIINGKGNSTKVGKRIAELKEQIKVANTDYDKEIKRERMAKLSGGVAVINVGGATETEQIEKKERVIDAVNATKAAIEEGIVAGGEVTLFELAKKQKGILGKALKAPFKKLIENAGMEYAEVWHPVIYPVGIDISNGEVKDLIEAGIIDPVKVTRSALENASSIACMLITTDVMVVDEPEEK